jgi:hypothetical protein
MHYSERVAAVANDEKSRALSYGCRKADKLVRCYQKDSLGVFRVEAELHSGLLRHNDISTLDDFLHLPGIVYTTHFQFVALDWRRLERYLSRRLGHESSRIIVGARGRAASLRRVRRYLRRNGVVNLHRFFVPLTLNEEVSRALDRWVRQFNKESLWVSTK